MSDILAYAFDGCLRIRRLNKNKCVIEIRSHLYPGSWRWCVQKSFPNDEAWELFDSQCLHHVNPDYFQPVVNKGE